MIAPKHLLPYVTRLKGTVAALEAACRSEDEALILEASAAVTRVHKRLAGAMGKVEKVERVNAAS